jgi:hypothetical protein
MRTAKIEFRQDIFDKYFDIDDYTISHSDQFDKKGKNWIIFKDNVIDNDEQSFRAILLDDIKNTIGISDLLENKETVITYDDKMNPNTLRVHLDKPDGRVVCEIIEINEI